MKNAEEKTGNRQPGPVASIRLRFGEPMTQEDKVVRELAADACLTRVPLPEERSATHNIDAEISGVKKSGT